MCGHGNQGFLAAFVEATGHRAALSAGDGWNGPVLSRRVKNAILSAFLGGEDRQVISQLVEGADELGIKNVANALMGAAPRLMKFKGSPYDISGQVASGRSKT